MSLIILHVGAFKTGTSFIQHTLAANRESLASEGILYPGVGPGSHFSAVRDFVRSTSSRGPRMPSWTELIAQCARWEGRLAILSAENLSSLRGEALARAVAPLQGLRVRVVYGARDIARAVPSQWQSYIRNGDGHAPTYPAYVAAVMADEPADPAARMFWATHDWPGVLQAWRSATHPEDLVLLSVPPSGSDESLLWQRFGQAAGFDTRAFPLATMRNSSVGAESAEVIRRVSLAIATTSSDTGDRVTRNRVLRSLSRRVLAQRRAEELRVVFPPDGAGWVREKTSELLRGVDALAPVLVGRTSDLHAQVSSSVPAGATTRPEAIPPAGILDAALDALARSGRPGVAESIRSGPEPPEEKLARAIENVTDVLLSTIGR